MTLDCDRCHQHVPSGDVVVHREIDDGFAIYEFRCRACGAHGVGNDPAIVATLLDAGVRQLRLIRTDRLDPEREAERLRDALDTEDFLDRLTGVPSWPWSPEADHGTTAEVGP